MKSKREGFIANTEQRILMTHCCQLLIYGPYDRILLYVLLIIYYRYRL